MTGATLLGSLLFLIFYFQIVLGYSPLRSGLASLPITATIMVVVGILTKSIARIGVRLPMTLGPLIAAAGLIWLSFISVEDSYVTTVLPGIILLGVGLAMIFVPLQNVALYGIDTKDAGVASANLNATQQIGGSIGTAVLTAVYTAVMTGYLSDHPAGPATMPSAFVAGYSQVFIIAAIIIACAAPISALLVRTPKSALRDTTTTVHIG
jgi:Na+/melibiose symporter-like transporter